MLKILFILLLITSYVIMPQSAEFTPIDNQCDVWCPSPTPTPTPTPDICGRYRTNCL